MVTTITRAVPRPVQRTTALITTVVVLVVLSFPVASGLQVRPASGALPSHGLVSATEKPGDREDPQAADERTTWEERITSALPTQVCDQRLAVRDLPDAVPSGALRLAAWDRPWWLLPSAPFDPVPEQADAGELPQTRGPPLTAYITV